MKLVLALASLLVAAKAFAPVRQGARPAIALNNLSEEFGIPCEEECALESYPNLPESIHPGVVSGQALIDLLNHAKENGKMNYAGVHVQLCSSIELASICICESPPT